MDEKLKHRLIGLTVIFSIFIIVMPAMMKKSNQRFERVTMDVKLPPKPMQPSVAIKNETEMFQRVQTARVELPQVQQEIPKNQLAKMEPAHPLVSEMSRLPTLKTAAVKDKAKSVIKKERPNKPSARQITKKATTAQKIYTVQLASFSQFQNAKSLLAGLEKKGYQAKIKQIKGKQGNVYKVHVGAVKDKKQAENLREQLADAVQLQGLIINTEVS